MWPSLMGRSTTSSHRPSASLIARTPWWQFIPALRPVHGRVSSFPPGCPSFQFQPDRSQAPSFAGSYALDLRSHLRTFCCPLPELLTTLARHLGISFSETPAFKECRFQNESDQKLSLPALHLA